MTDKTPARRGTTNDPEQADNTGLPPRKPDPTTDKDTPGVPGTTNDPNQADR
ncbi:hypothetical protein [Loktanella sp. SALINAS62]|uniref:hypothetical protein n=1 Tax=Loktanella sp. SALINAS62 TaxID=2706124 RepID=UPI001B8D8933|nr:hypothetical protein [Loktanella sp. SALINAS62]MBS1303324.1 hypothetical protein [Loktanella sp. SALINAS62]